MARSTTATPRAQSARFFVHLVVSLTLGFLLMACGEETIAPRLVGAVVAQVVVEPNGHTLKAGEQLPFTTRVFDSKGRALEGRYVTWATSDETVANVSASGVVTGLSAGTVSIQATVEGTVGTARLDVSNAVVASVNIGLPEVTMQQGESKTLTAIVKDSAGRVIRNRALAWHSADVTIASVDPTGTITAVGPGTVEVTAQIDEIVARVTVHVTEPMVEQVVITPSLFTIELGETRQLQAVLKDKFGNTIPGREILWTADNEAVRIDSSGFVTGLQAGEVTIIATSGGVSGLVDATVVAAAPYAYDLLYNRVSFGGMSELFVIDLAGGGAPSLLNAGSVARAPTASPDGSRVAFAVSIEDLATGQRVDDIFVVNRDGLHMTRLTGSSGIDEAPAWSPLDGRIAYQHWDPSGRSDIWSMDTFGSDTRNLTSDMPSGPFRSGAAWTRDGSRIAFLQSETIGSGTTTSIWVMRADGTEKRQLTSSATAFYGTPTWSPDGTQLAFVHHYGADADITIMDVNSGSTSRIRVPGYEENPSWSPDGSLIAFTSGWAVYTVRPDGSNLRLRTLDPAWGSAGSATWIARR